jgi:flagellar FliJ protein
MKDNTMMSTLKPLQTLLECAQRERDEAIARLEQTRAAHQAAADQAQALGQWRSEYAQRWQSQFAQGASAEIVRCYQDFMARLTQAMSEQELVVNRTHSSLEAARAILAAREQRMAAVEQLIERRMREVTALARRREQKDTDEQAARAVASRTGTSQGAAQFDWLRANPDPAVPSNSLGHQPDFISSNV